MKFPSSEFWDFSTRTYQIPQVETACLSLQDNVNADVNIILYCCWLGENRQPLGADDMALLLDTSQRWQQAILQPLRNARRMMKQHIIAMPAELLEQTVRNMSDMEINAEHMEQQALEKALDLDSRPADDSRNPLDISAANLSLYLRQLDGVSGIADIAADVTALLDAIYQDAEAIQLALMSAAG
ncbi:MAG TPA: TIGR02444 family protein [Pseudomonadales bacterium]